MLWYLTGTAANADTRLVWFSRDGTQLGQVGDPAPHTDIHVSDDGKNISVTRPVRSDTGGTNQVWIGDVARGIFTRLTNERFSTGASVFGPDGRLAFTSMANGARGDIYSALIDGSWMPEPWVTSSTLKMPNDFSPDGRLLVYEEAHPTRRTDLWVYSIENRKLIPFATTMANETLAEFSPDGNWVAYASDEEGRRKSTCEELRRTERQAPDVQCGLDHRRRKTAVEPRRPEIYYLAPDGKLMVVPVRTGPAFEPGIPMPLFPTRITGFSSYDVAPGGRFLMNVMSEATPQSSSAITVLLNWQKGLLKE